MGKTKRKCKNGNCFRLAQDRSGYCAMHNQ